MKHREYWCTAVTVISILPLRRKIYNTFMYFFHDIIVLLELYDGM